MDAVDAGLHAIHVEIERHPGCLHARTELKSNVILGAHDAFKRYLDDVKSKTKFLLSKPISATPHRKKLIEHALANNVITRQPLLRPGAPVLLGQFDDQMTHHLSALGEGGYAVPAWPRAGEHPMADFTVETWAQFPDSFTVEESTPQVRERGREGEREGGREVEMGSE